jgi:DNA replication initiation complex subunit (GINS family)
LPDEELDYETISQLFQKERKVSRLTEITPKFYDEVSKYIKNLETEYLKEFQKNPASPTTMLLREEQIKITRLLKHIYEIRERKVVLFALNKVKGSSQDVKNITPQEQLLLNEVIEVLARTRSPILDKTQSTTRSAPDETATKTETIDQEPAELELEEETEPVPIDTEQKPQVEPARSKTQPGHDYVVALVIDDISSFVGTDLNTYDLNREDVVSLPKDVASILVKNNKIRLLN